MEVRIKEIKTNLEIFDVYSLFEEEDCILLESGKDKNRLGKYSIIGLNPFKKITYNNKIVIEDGEARVGDPFDALKRVLASHKIENSTDLPFIGGGIGYLSYDLVRDMEKLPDLNEGIVSIPTLYFVFYDNVIIFDHYQGRVYITELVRMHGSIGQMDVIEAKIASGDAADYSPGEKHFDHKFTSPFTKDSYIKAVERMRGYIKSGDIYIANMTHAFSTKTERDSYDIFKSLRKMNKAPFSAYMPLDGFQVMCSSPERFLQVKSGKVETRPIKGTRPRMEDPKEDAKMRLELEQSEKDKSELLMVVDLERNDLSKVCRPYTVKVTELFEIETYATVHHLVSTVVGELRKEQTAVDLVRACFPGGSITGTPKIRAMEVIEELEMTKRNIYTGCIGYFGFDGDCDLNIVIRTMVKQGDNLVIGVGGGITWESDAESEYQETLDKAGVLFEALNTVM